MRTVPACEHCGKALEAGAFVALVSTVRLLPPYENRPLDIPVNRYVVHTACADDWIRFTMTGTKE